MKNLIAAIDLGTTKVVATIGEKTANGIRIIAYSEVASKGIKRGRVENPKLASAAIKEAIRQIEIKHNLTIKKAFVGLAGHDIKCITQPPFLTQRPDADKMISTQEITALTKGMYETKLDNGYKVLEAIPQSYNVDNQISVSQPEGMIGKTITCRYNLIIGKENFTYLTMSTLKFAGVEMLESVIEPIASARAVLTDDEMAAGVVLVDIGGGTTDVIVVQNNIIRYIGIIPFGGNSITEDIGTGCNISPKQAESLKTNHGCCFSDYADANKSICIKSIGGNKDIEIKQKGLAKIIQARMEEILDAVYWHINQSGFQKAIRAGIVFTGGGAQIGNLHQLANSITGMEARVASPHSDNITDNSVEGVRKMTSSTAVGMIINGFKKMEDEGIYYPGSVVFTSDLELEEQSKAKDQENQIEREKVMVESNKATKAKSEKKGWLKSIGKSVSGLKFTLFDNVEDDEDNKMDAI